MCVGSFHRAFVSVLTKRNISEENYGDNIHGNLFEALIGAIFLDRGYPYCKKFIFDRVINPHVNLQPSMGNV